MTPESLMSRVGLDKVRTQLHLLVEKLKNSGRAELSLLLICAIISS